MLAKMSPRRGFTLIELMVTIVIAAVLLGLAVPSFSSMMAKSRLEGALNGLSIDLQYARSQSIRTQRTVTLQVSNDGASYTISDSSGVLKTVTLPTGVALTPSAAVSFDALRGIAPATSIDGTSTGAAGTLRAATNAMGRAQLCSPGGSYAGFTPC